VKHIKRISPLIIRVYTCRKAIWLRQTERETFVSPSTSKMIDTYEPYNRYDNVNSKTTRRWKWFRTQKQYLPTSYYICFIPLTRLFEHCNDALECIYSALWRLAGLDKRFVYNTFPDRFDSNTYIIVKCKYVIITQSI